MSNSQDHQAGSSRPAKPFQRLLLTGAAGNLGQVLRERLKPWTEVVRLSDIGDLGAAAAGEEIVACDLADKAAVYDMLEEIGRAHV